TRSGLGSNKTTQRLAQFCIEVLRIDLYFGNGVHRRVDENDPEHRVTVICAIQLERRTTEMPSVHVDVEAALWVFVWQWIRKAEGYRPQIDGSRGEKL